MERIELLQLMGFTADEAIAKAAQEETVRATFRTATRNDRSPSSHSQAPRAWRRQRGRNLHRLHHRRQRRDLGPLLQPEGLWLLTDRPLTPGPCWRGCPAQCPGRRLAAILAISTHWALPYSLLDSTLCGRWLEKRYTAMPVTCPRWPSTTSTTSMPNAMPSILKSVDHAVSPRALATNSRARLAIGVSPMLIRVSTYARQI